MTATHKFPMPTVSFGLTTSGLQAALKCWAERLNRRVVRRQQDPA